MAAEGEEDGGAAKVRGGRGEVGDDLSSYVMFMFMFPFMFMFMFMLMFM